MPICFPDLPTEEDLACRTGANTATNQRVNSKSDTIMKPSQTIWLGGNGGVHAVSSVSIIDKKKDSMVDDNEHHHAGAYLFSRAPLLFGESSVLQRHTTLEVGDGQGLDVGM